MTDLSAAVEAGMRYIVKQQRPDGGFDGLASANPDTFENPRLHPTIFFTALIAQCCHGIPGSKRLLESASGYLLRHKSKQWSWNYWQRDEAGKRMPGYPDDLDDTACAVAALAGYDASLINAGALGSLGRLLVASEVKLGGPYQTWLVAKKDLKIWHDVDVAVNANIAYMLRKLGVTVPGLDDYLYQALEGKRLRSSYYLGSIPSLYFITRIGSRTHQTVLRRLVNAELHRSPDNRSPLMNALLLTTACRLALPKSNLRVLAQSLLATRQGNHWPAAALYVEPPVDGVPYYAGSAALTTAYVCEALSAYSQLSEAGERAESMQPANATTCPARTVYASMRRAAGKLEGLELRSDYLSALRRIECMDVDGQIGMLAVQLQRDIGARLPAKQLRYLQMASINGWLAYTLYDDVLDAASTAKHLGTATLALRRSVQQFHLALPDSPSFQEYVEQALTTVDNANAWESLRARAAVKDGVVRITRLPDYGAYDKLAERSWGHILASCGVLIAHGYELGGREISAWQRFFHHFLIARQLNDDAHDWEEDLTQGQLSAVVSMLLSASKVSKRLHIARGLPGLKEIFWSEVVEQVCAIITEQVDKAEEALEKCTFIIQKDYYRQMLAYVRGAVASTRHARGEALAFLEGFTK